MTEAHGQDKWVLILGFGEEAEIGITNTDLGIMSFLF